MPENKDKTKDKIIHSALTLFMEQGIGKTSLTEVAYHAGVSRITIYRYFEDKETLVLASFLSVEAIFQDGFKQFEQQPSLTLQSILENIGKNLQKLPQGNAVARADELKRLYPYTYDKVQKVRQSILNEIFNQFSERAKGKHLFREELNKEVARAVFEELIINFFDNPRFKTLDLNDAELFRQISNIYLFGILKGGLESF